MERLLKGIEDDERSILSSRSSRSTGSSWTLTGIGTTSGKAIMAIGEVVLQSVDAVRIHSRLRAIEGFVNQGEDYIPAKYYEELLEYQRYGIYSTRTRYRAWDILLLLMERRRTEQLTDIITSWPAVETQLVIRQLSVYKLSGWTLHPARLVRIHGTDDKSEAHNALRTARESSLTHSYRNILGCVLKKDPAIIHEVLGADEYVYLQTPPIGDRIGDINSPSFPYVFEYLLHEYEQARPSKWELPLPASDFVDFLTSGPTKQCDRVLLYTTQRVLFLSQNDTPDGKSTMEVHTAPPYLWFMVHLAIRSKFACQGIVNGNILEILRNLWKSGHLSLNGTNQVQQDLERLCCILLGAISYQGVFPRLVGRLLDFDATWFLNIFPRFISEFAIISSICLPYLPAILPDDRSEFYRELLVLAGTPQVSQHRDQFEVRTWKVVMGELDQDRGHFITAALLSLPSRGMKVAFIRKLVEARISHPYVTTSTITVEKVTEIKGRRPENLLDHTKATNDLRILGVQRIVKAVHAEQPLIIYDAVDIDMVAFIQTQSVERPTNGSDALRILIETHSSAEIVQYGSLELPPPQHYYLEYVKGAPQVQQVTIAHHLLRQLRDTTIPSEQDADFEDRTRILRALRLLQFIFHFAHQSQEITVALVNGGVLDVLSALWSLKHVSGIPVHGRVRNTAFSRDALQRLVLVLLGILTLHCPDVPGTIMQDRRFYALAEFDHIRMLSAQMCIHVVDDGWHGISSSILSFLPSWGSTQHSQCPSLSETTVLKQPWEMIVQSIWRNGSRSQNIEQRIAACEEVLKLCAIAPQESWRATLGNMGHNLYAAFTFIIHDYLSCDTGSVTFSTRRTLIHLNAVATVYGYETTNPVDRFLLFISTICSNAHARDAYTLKDSGVSLLIGSLAKGTFDFCGPSSATQRQLRGKESASLLGFISVLVANHDAGAD